jgi:hypothetical protein
VARLVRAIQEISGYRGQATVRRHFREFENMNCQHALIDAFTDKVFDGNPAAICLLVDWLNDDLNGI